MLEIIEIDEKIKSELEQIYPNIKKQYGYFGFNELEFEQLFKEHIKETNFNYSENMLKTFSEYYQDTIYKTILKAIKKSNKMEIFTSNYINHFLTPKKTQQENILELQKLGHFLSSLTSHFSSNFYQYLFENNKILVEILNNIIPNQQKIKESKIISSSTNKNIQSLLEDYCSYKNITIIEDSDDLDISDNISLYLRELSEHLLTFEEEQELGKKILEGNQEAIEKMVNHNLRLVISIVKRFKDKKMSQEDLIQEGNIGLIIAASRFDYRKGYRFSTYATYWIMQTITRGIQEKGLNIRVPVGLQIEHTKYLKEVYSLGQKLGHAPTKEDIIENLSYPKEKLKQFDKIQETISLQQTIGEEEDSIIEDFIIDQESSTEENYIQDNMKEQVQLLIKKCLELKIFKEREYIVLINRYGLNGTKEKTLEEVGQMLGITRERVRQIEKNALRKLRYHREILHYADYMDNPENCKKYIKAFRQQPAKY